MKAFKSVIKLPVGAEGENHIGWRRNRACAPTESCQVLPTNEQRWMYEISLRSRQAKNNNLPRCLF